MPRPGTEPTPGSGRRYPAARGRRFVLVETVSVSVNAEFAHPSLPRAKVEKKLEEKYLRLIHTALPPQSLPSLFISRLDT